MTTIDPSGRADWKSRPWRRGVPTERMEGMTERSNQGAPSRRAFVAGVGGVALGLLAPRAPAQQASAIKRGGTFVESINWTYPSLDPHLSSQPFMAGHEAMTKRVVRYELGGARPGGTNT